MPSKPNVLKERITAGDKLIGLWCSLTSATAVEVLSTLEYDWLLLDMEHAPNDLAEIVAQLRVLDSSNISAVVRPPSSDRVMIKRLLDLGAKNLLFPNVQSADEAREIVRSTRYAPEGVRGVSLSGRASLYGVQDRYLQDAADEISIGVQIETLAAFNAMPEIAALPEVDVLFFGPADLSADMGLLGQGEHPDVQAQIIQGIQLITARNKMAGVLAPNLDVARTYAQAGAKFIAIGSDIACLRARAQALLQVGAEF